MGSLLYKMYMDWELVRDRLYALQKDAPELKRAEQAEVLARGVLAGQLDPEGTRLLSLYDDSRNATAAMGEWYAYRAGANFMAELLREALTP